VLSISFSSIGAPRAAILPAPVGCRKSEGTSAVRALCRPGETGVSRTGHHLPRMAVQGNLLID